MSIHPQFTFDNNGNPVDVFLCIEDWNGQSSTINIELPQWQKDALDIELEAMKKNLGYAIPCDKAKASFPEGL